MLASSFTLCFTFPSRYLPFYRRLVSVPLKEEEKEEKEKEQEQEQEEKKNKK